MAHGDLGFVKTWGEVFMFRSMLPLVAGEVSLEIKKLIKSLAEYEFEIDALLDEDAEEEKAKVIAIKRIIWRGLGKDAYKEWYNYLHFKSDTYNSFMLGIMMYKQLLENTYRYIKEIEREEEKKKPRQTRLAAAQKRTVSFPISH